MKKFYSILFLLFIFKFCFSQEKNISKDTISLNEIVITKGNIRKDMMSIIKKIKHNLKENYNLNPINYLTNHFSVKDDKDTLVNRKIINNLNAKYLNQTNIFSMLLDDPTNPFHTDTTPYSRFIPIAISSQYWLALSIFYDSLHVINFNFFENISNYTYKISKLDNVTKVTFTASRFYNGYFTFNNSNYNLIRIAFVNTKPYDYYSWGYEGNLFEFESHWKYNKVTILLDFAETDEGKLLLTKLDAMEELTQFEFKRYLPNSKRVIDQGRNIKFYTTLNMRILE